jgi:hypothetical protein
MAMDFLKKLNLTAEAYENTPRPKAPPKDPVGKKQDVDEFEKGFNEGGSLSSGWKNLKKAFGKG